jgi:K+-sensing histidine kinase KdpD
LDQTGLPRWGVIVWAGGGSAGEVPDALDVIREDGLSTAPLTRILRSAWHRHLLERENWKLRGYLMTFGSRISHDLRTPLGGILTTTEMLREVLLDDAPADVPLIQPILDSTDGLVKLIERSSFFARASSSKEPRRVVDMAMPFWSAYQQVERLMIKSRVTFDHPPSWPKVSGHESWLEIVWGILLRNAVEYSPEGSRIAAGWTALDRDLRFWIRSEGQVRPEKQAGLFFPFQRLHEPGAPRGLGLPMMRGIIELEGGTCGFEAPSSGGVEFFFTLPTVPDLNPTTDSTGVMP